MKKILYIVMIALVSLMTACGKKAEEKQQTMLGFTPQMDSVYMLCLEQTSDDPIYILEQLMSQPYCPMHGPLHHSLAGMALLTAYHNAGGETDLSQSLPELIRRAQQVPGAACGNWGACGASLSCGMMMSIVTENGPLATEAWHLSNLCTARALERVANNGGPRCCKRDCYLSVESTVDFINEEMGIKMGRRKTVCSRSELNSQCIGSKCPYSPVRE